jgi:hypothetical protein
VRRRLHGGSRSGLQGSAVARAGRPPGRVTSLGAAGWLCADAMRCEDSRPLHSPCAGVGSSARSYCAVHGGCSRRSLPAHANARVRLRGLARATPRDHEAAAARAPPSSTFQDEDALLLSLVGKHKARLKAGQDIWPDVAPTFPGRTPKQCKERYTHHLVGYLGTCGRGRGFCRVTGLSRGLTSSPGRVLLCSTSSLCPRVAPPPRASQQPDISKAPWAPKEEALLFHLQATIGEEAPVVGCVCGPCGPRQMGQAAPVDRVPPVLPRYPLLRCEFRCPCPFILLAIRPPPTCRQLLDGHLARAAGALRRQLQEPVLLGAAAHRAGAAGRAVGGRGGQRRRRARGLHRRHGAHGRLCAVGHEGGRLGPRAQDREAHGRAVRGREGGGEEEPTPDSRTLLVWAPS